MGLVLLLVFRDGFGNFAGFGGWFWYVGGDDFDDLGGDSGNLVT